MSIDHYRCWCWAWRRWFSPRELKSRTVYIGHRYQGFDKQKNQVKNEIRNQVILIDIISINHIPKY